MESFSRRHSLRLMLGGAAGLSNATGLLAMTPTVAPGSAGNRLRVMLLGTQGGPNFNATRGESANVLALGDRLFMVDCGYGALSALVERGFNYRNVERIFLTHLHDDHMADVVSLLGHQWTGGKVTATTVHGPAGTNRLVRAAIGYNQVNEEIRLIDEARSVRLTQVFRSQEVMAAEHPAVVFKDDTLVVTAVENTHYPLSAKRNTKQRSLAYRIEGGGRSVVFSGDTAYSAELVSLARGAELFVCEAMHVAATRREFDKRVAAGAYADNPEGIWKHIVETHTPLEDAGRMAREANVETLVLNHVIPGGWDPTLDDEFYIREATRTFDGKIVVGRDGLEL